MTAFLISLAVLVGGYFLYGLLAEKVFGTDPARTMPAYSKTDGVDFMPMPTWKVFLIQFLNIAGLGPIFGAIMGVMYGPAAFIWIVAGTIFGGAVHDFISAMMSIRSDGESLPELIGRQLGMPARQIMRLLSIVLLVLVGAVFVITPSNLMASMTPGWAGTEFWMAVIFSYYLLATLLPVDKLIGRFYPVFGFALLFMAAGLSAVLIFGGHSIPVDFAGGFDSRYGNDGVHSVFPMMFVSIACGAVSGFHATQSPMMARCLKNERLARPIFYGAMVAEGIVALIWAAAAIAFTGGYGELGEYLGANGGAGGLVHNISIEWLGSFGGILAIIGVVAAPITTGDTALRSARLIAADFLKIDQTKIIKRLLLSLPIFAATYIIMQTDFSILWRYFAWCNQTLAVFTLWAITVYLGKRGGAYIVAMLPAMFMTCVCITYILFAPEGLGLNYSLSVGIGATASLVLCIWYVSRTAFSRRLSPAED